MGQRDAQQSNIDDEELDTRRVIVLTERQIQAIFLARIRLCQSKGITLRHGKFVQIEVSNNESLATIDAINALEELLLPLGFGSSMRLQTEVLPIS